MGKLAEIMSEAAHIAHTAKQDGYWMALSDALVPKAEAVELFKIRWGEEPTKEMLHTYEEEVE